jgi:hypothetical protein
MDKMVLGIYFDGLSVQAALVSSAQGIFRVEQLESFKLFDSFEQSQNEDDRKDRAESQNNPNDDPDNPFGVDLDMSNQPTSDVGQARGNVDIIIEMITKMTHPGCPIAFNLQNSEVFYKTFNIDPKTTSLKLKKLISKEFNDTNEGTINLQNIDYIRHDSGACLGMVHYDPLIFTNVLQQAMKLTRRSQTPIYLIDSLEFALAEYISKTVNIESKARLSVIHFSENFTKIFFMKGHKIEDVLPTIHTGAKSVTICETAFSKILYEFDFKGIDAPQTLVLTGEISQVNAEFFFREKFPDLDIVTLEPDESTLSPEIKNMAGNISPYSTSIALANKALLPKKERKYKTNFVPKSIKEKQSQFVVAWHGFAALGLIFITILFFFTQNVSLNKDIHKTKMSLKNIEGELHALNRVEHQVDSLRTEINNIETGASLIDSLASATTRWTPLIETFSEAINDLGLFSINQFSSISSEKMLVDLNLSNLEQVAHLERFIPESKVLTVKNTETEDSDELLQLIIECKMSNEIYDKKQQNIVAMNDSTITK